MSGRGRGGHGGCGGNGGRGGRGRGRGHGCRSHGSTSTKGMCSALGTNIFDYGARNAADRMRTTWDKIGKYVSTEHGNDIANKLKNKRELAIPEPTCSAEVQARQAN